MFTKEQTDTIEQLLQQKGPQGVNAICRELGGIPLSTVDKYLKKQNYFKQDASRKWDLPGNVAVKEQNVAVKNFDTVIDTHLQGIEAMSDLLINNMKSAIALLAAQKSQSTSVAGINECKRGHIPTEWEEGYDSIKVIQEALKKHKDTITDKYKTLLNNMNWYDMFIEMGTLYMKKYQTDFVSYILGQSDELPDEFVESLLKYPKS